MYYCRIQFGIYLQYQTLNILKKVKTVVLYFIFILGKRAALYKVLVWNTLLDDIIPVIEEINMYRTAYLISEKNKDKRE